MEYTRDFEKLVRKMRRKHQTCLNYIFRMKEQTLTEGFWYNHGYTFDDQLTTLKNKYTDQWKHYCKQEGIAWDAVVADWLC